LSPVNGRGGDASGLGEGGQEGKAKKNARRRPGHGKDGRTRYDCILKVATPRTICGTGGQKTEPPTTKILLSLIVRRLTLILRDRGGRGGGGGRCDRGANAGHLLREARKKKKELSNKVHSKRKNTMGRKGPYTEVEEGG